MQVSNLVRDREVMVGRVTAAHKAALLLESRLEVMVNDLTPGNGLAQAYEQLMAIKGAKVFLLSYLTDLDKSSKLGEPRILGRVKRRC